MNEYLYSDIEVGMKASFEAVITENMMGLFKELSGDTNPLHLDSKFAKDVGYDNKVVYGLLTSSLLSKLVGIYLPGKYCLLRSVETKYIRPVYVDEKLNISGEVIEVNDTVCLVTIKANATNEHGDIVLKAKIKVGFTK